MSDLIERCKEILAWKRTGLLPGDALRQYAEAKWKNDYASLQLAEAETVREALEALTAQPAITSESGNQAVQGASAITSESVPLLTQDEIADLARGRESHEDFARAIEQAVRSKLLPQHECTRSHPHENMDGFCVLRTEIARLTNENARLKSGFSDAAQVLTLDEISDLAMQSGAYDEQLLAFARTIEKLVRSKLGAGVGWQSIRTAPKDGTHILAVLPDSDTCYVICWVDAAKEIRSYLSVGTAAGWHHAYDGDPIAPHDHPTHWQQLPPPPGIVGKEGGK